MCKVIQRIGIVVLFAANAIAADEAAPTAAETLRSYFLSSEFRFVQTQGELPSVLVDNFEAFGPSAIADIGALYNYSDYIDGALPSRQMVLAGISDDVTFLVLNQGGYAPYRYTILVGEVSGVVYLCSYYFGSPEIVEFDNLSKRFEVGAYIIDPECENAV